MQRNYNNPNFVNVKEKKWQKALKKWCLRIQVGLIQV